MIFFSNSVLHILDWIADRLALDLGLREEGGCLDCLDEREIIDQLHYGRD
jgi:hypothetical protein